MHPHMLTVHLVVARLVAAGSPAQRTSWDDIAPSPLTLDTGSDVLAPIRAAAPVQVIDPRQAPLAMLSPQDDLRARRLRDPRDRDTSTCAHVLLRGMLIKQGVPRDSAMAEFTKGVFGKPRLAGGLPVHFSLSYRRGWIAIAIAASPVGVDIDLITPDIDAHGIAERFFHPDEAALLKGLQGGELVNAFFGLWTRKEALIKAAGLGVDYMAATPAIKSPAVLPDETGATATYHVQQLGCAAEVALAVALRLPDQDPDKTWPPSTAS
jgi:4'-phosphopantetheinyl transferase